MAATAICCLRADNKYTTLATRDGTSVMNSPLKRMKDKLDH